MTNNEDMLRNIEYLREKADISYEEASELLERNGDNVMRALVELEQQGRVYQKGQEGAAQSRRPEKSRHEKETRQAREKTTSVVNRAFRNRLVVERTREDGERETVANLSMPFAVGATIVAPYLAVGSAILTFAAGYKVRVAKEMKKPQVPESVDAFVSQTVSNIKQTASSLEKTAE